MAYAKFLRVEDLSISVDQLWKEIEVRDVPCGFSAQLYYLTDLNGVAILAFLKLGQHSVSTMSCIILIGREDSDTALQEWIHLVNAKNINK